MSPETNKPELEVIEGGAHYVRDQRLAAAQHIMTINGVGGLVMAGYNGVEAFDAVIDARPTLPQHNSEAVHHAGLAGGGLGAALVAAALYGKVTQLRRR